MCDDLSRNWAAVSIGILAPQAFFSCGESFTRARKRNPQQESGEVKRPKRRVVESAEIMQGSCQEDTALLAAMEETHGKLKKAGEVKILTLHLLHRPWRTYWSGATW